MTHEDSLSRADPSSPAFEDISSKAQVSFRSKHGAPLDTNVVPVKPMTTASAVVPTPRPAAAAPAGSADKPHAKPQASFMTTLPGQEELAGQDRSGGRPSPSFAAHEEICPPEESPLPLGQRPMGNPPMPALSRSSRPGMVVAGLVVCGMLLGIAGLWWAEQPPATQARSSQPASEASFAARNSSAFAATAYNPGSTGYAIGASQATNAQLVIPPLPSLEHQQRKGKGVQDDADSYALNKEDDSEDALQDEENEMTQPNDKPTKVAAVPKPRRNKPMSKTQRTLQALRSCTRDANLFEREKCKWKICGDSWGKNGCPSYN